MPLYAFIDGQPRRVLEDGPRRASCADCGAPMRARTGSVRIWHWAHLQRNPHCEAARETEWHLAWKVLGLDGTQEVKVGRRRADVLAPGGFAVEFQASALTGEEVRAREDDWSAQGGMAWVFKADQAHIEVTEQYLPQWLHLLKPENQMTVRVTWPRAPERVRAAHAPSFLDVGNDELLFIGGWRPDSSPLSGWGWKVAKNWVVENLLYADQIPGPLADDPADVFRRIDAWERKQRERERASYLRRQERTAKLAAKNGPWQERWRVGRGSCDIVLRAVEDLLKTGPAGFYGPELWPLRDNPAAVRAVWLRAAEASGWKLPTAEAIRRARQEYEQEIRRQVDEDTQGPEGG